MTNVFDTPSSQYLSIFETRKRWNSGVTHQNHGPIKYIWYYGQKSRSRLLEIPQNLNGESQRWCVTASRYNGMGDYLCERMGPLGSVSFMFNVVAGCPLVRNQYVPHECSDQIVNLLSLVFVQSNGFFLMCL
jgi:hypothetical protein